MARNAKTNQSRRRHSDAPNRRTKRAWFSLAGWLKKKAWQLLWKPFIYSGMTSRICI
mgnify:CR=1 FL=1